jgi:hypothetical protein
MPDRDQADEIETLRQELAEARATSYLNPDGSHRYWASACIHDDHATCQTEAVRYDGTTKTPAQCKTCGSPCVCDCHGGAS